MEQDRTSAVQFHHPELAWQTAGESPSELLNNQLVGEPGRPDIIAVDSDGALALLELKADPATVGALLQALRYHEWLTDKRAILARVYPQLRPDRPVRLFIGAPAFDEEIRRLARYLSIDVTFVTLLTVKNSKSGEIGLLIQTEEVDRMAPDELRLYTTQEILDYLTDPIAKADLQKVLADLKVLGLEMRSYRAGKYRWVEFHLKGDEIAYLGTLQKAFKFQHWDPALDDYVKPFVVESYDHWCQTSKPAIELYLRSVQTACGTNNEVGQRACNDPC